MQGLVDHHDRASPATGQALDKFQCKTPIFGRLRSMLLGVKPQLFTEVSTQFVAAIKSATEGAAHLDVVFAERFLPEHRVKRDQFVNIDRLEIELLGRPFDRLLRDAAKTFLDRVQKHERRTPLLRVMRDQFIQLGF